MEHVSTLCAISTVGIAATGFALGRVERPSSKLGRFRKKTLPQRDHCAPTTDTVIPPASGAATPDSPHFPPGILNPKAPHVTNPPAQDQQGAFAEIQSGGSHFRRKSSLAGVILRRRGHTLTSPPSQLNQDAPTTSHSRRSSWLRRLSIQPPETCSPNQGPWSPSSNSPASPNISRPSSQRRVPNKLVKRPPSQHGPSSPLAPPLSRRPATSYQRSEALRHRATHSLNFEPNFIPNPFSQPAEFGGSVSSENDAWQPYLKTSSDGLAGRLARRLSTTTKPREQALRRILPSPDAAPVLLLAASITNKEPANAVGLNEPAPSSPVQFRDPFKSIDPLHAPDAPSLVESEDGPSSNTSDEADPKSPMTSSSAADAAQVSSDLLVRPKRRAISTFLPELSIPKAALSDSKRLYGKRNITDPNVFRRPSAFSQTNFPDFMPPGFMRARRYITPPRADLGPCRDIGHRPLSSDAVALSAHENSIFRTFDSTFPWSLHHRPKRHSIAASDPASTAIGSDDTRIFTSGDEDESDFLTDTAFDSIRTHLTTGRILGSRIETMFDRSPTDGLMKIGSEAPIPSGPVAPRASDSCLCNLKADATPLADPRSISQGTADLDGDEDSRVSFPSDLSEDDDACSMVAALPGEPNAPRRSGLSLETSGYYNGSRVVLAKSGPGLPLNSEEAQALPRNKLRTVSSEARESYPKMNIFDWSEQSRSDREVAGSDERPHTVHGKHGSEMRGSRAPGRKAPNTLHLRSQSVPVSRDPIVANESRQSSGKFGTWGLGSKGVSEDWDSDFEFDDANEGSEKLSLSRSSSRKGMVVPAAILERQASLHGQFGQVQELTLLVEELKRLRHRASYLNIVKGPANELWKEAEGIVNLATLDDEENNDSPPRSPSSLTFSFDDSEGESSNPADPAKRASGDSWRASLSEKLHPNVDVSSCSQNSDTSTKAKSVLDLIYQQRVSHDPTLGNSRLSRSKKLPFDTQSLRDLVIRAGVVTRSLKEVIRKAEGVMTTPEDKTVSSDPPFSRIFDQPTDDNHLIYETHCVN